MKLSAHIRQQEQKTELDALYDLRNIARARGISSYILNRRLYVWCGGGYEDVTTEQQLEDICP
jgi:hypothetical protein